MNKFQSLLNDNFHSSDLVDATQAKVYESRYGINLYSYKATDPELQWKCSMGECDEGDMLWFWVSTVDSVQWINTNTDTLFPVGETITWPRKLTAQSLNNITLETKDAAETLGAYTLELTSANPTLALWLGLDESGKTMYSLTMRKGDTFAEPHFDFRVYQGSDPETFVNFRPSMASLVHVDFPGTPVSYATFQFDNSDYMVAADEDGDFWVYTYSLMQGLMEVEGDTYDQLYLIADFLKEQHMVPFPAV
ncbi:hypothetical protein D3C80_1023730 [compost metagenome]